jgi:hypothetical protein
MKTAATEVVAAPTSKIPEPYIEGIEYQKTKEILETT